LPPWQEVASIHSRWVSAIPQSEGEGEASDQRLLGLIRGLATELNDHPGLKKVWQRMSISQSEVGSQVSLQLEKLEQRVIH
jgi:hypothetical protein